MKSKDYGTEKIADRMVEKSQRRMLKKIVVEGEVLKAVYDRRSARSYIQRKSLPAKVKTLKITPFTVHIGGRKHTIKEACLLHTENREKISIKAYLVDKLDRNIDVLVGASDLQEYDEAQEFQKKITSGFEKIAEDIEARQKAQLMMTCIVHEAKAGSGTLPKKGSRMEKSKKIAEKVAKV